jgi:hypothetical protein
MGIRAFCTTCPKCGAWVVIRQGTATTREDAISYVVTCPNPECIHPEFKITGNDVSECEIQQHILERGYFLPSEMR